MSTIFDKWKQSLSNLKNNITTGVQSAKSKLGTWLDSLKASQKSQTATAIDTSTTTPMSQEANVGLPNPEIQKPNIAPKQQDMATIQAAQPTEQPTTPTVPEAPQQSNNFLDWYKSKYGNDYNGSFNRAEGMSDQDYETGNNLYQGYIQQQNLKNQYDSANQALDTSKATQRQEASILRDKMAKYLQLQNKNNGMANLGVTQSTGLQADTKYMNNLGQIESDIGSKKQDIFNEYINNKTNVESNVSEENQSITDKYQKYAREDEESAYNRKKYEEEQAYQKEQDAYNKQKYEEEQARVKSDSNFNEFMSVIEGGSFNTAAELEEFYGKYKESLTPEQQKIAEQQINFYKNNPDQKEIDKDIEGTKPQITDNGDGTTTEKTDNGDGTTTETKKDQEGNVVETKKGLTIDTSKGHNRYTSQDGVVLSSPTDNHLKITYGSNNNDHANNYDITYNGEQYKVEVGKEFSGSNTQLQEIYDYMRQSTGRQDIKEGDCVLYDGELYVASNTGRLWSIQDRSKLWAWNWGGKTASDLKSLFKKNFG